MSSSDSTWSYQPSQAASTSNLAQPGHAAHYDEHFLQQQPQQHPHFAHGAPLAQNGMSQQPMLPFTGQPVTGGFDSSSSPSLHNHHTSSGDTSSHHMNYAPYVQPVSSFHAAQGSSFDNLYPSSLAGMDIGAPSSALSAPPGMPHDRSGPPSQQPFPPYGHWGHQGPSFPSGSSLPHGSHVDMFAPQSTTTPTTTTAGGMPSNDADGFQPYASHGLGGQYQGPLLSGPSTGSMQRPRKPAALNLTQQPQQPPQQQPQQHRQVPQSPFGTTADSSKTPSAAPMFNEQQTHFATGPSSWHAPQQPAQSPYTPVFDSHQRNASSTGLFSPMQSDASHTHTGMPYNSHNLGQPFALQHQHSLEALTPTSSQHSGHSTRVHEQAHHPGMLRNTSHGGFTHHSSDSFSQSSMSQGDSQSQQPHQQQHQHQQQQQPWLASPAESDISSFAMQQRQQQQHQRKISTPQRLQHNRDHSQVLPNPQIAGLPGNLATNGVGVDFDSTDYRLSSALASNAHISATTPTKNRQREASNSTPAMLVKAEQERRDTAALVPPSPSLGESQQQQQFQQQQQKQSQPQPQYHPQADYQERLPASYLQSLIAKKHRPNIRPNIFQQYASFTFSEEPGRDAQDCTSFIDEALSEYLVSPSRLGMGERSVLIMTSKVAQKSYGNEKRFLCPPPMVLLVGSSWWSSCQEGKRDGDESKPTVLTPPRLTISMSGESSMQESPLEWASHSGRLIDVGNPSSEMAISGRSIGRQLFINDADEKRRHCEALVNISMPGTSSSDRRSLGTFASKPIKVISKPSKKRQSTRTSDFSVNHGSTISLFHRLRSQTVSTRYLCVSGAPTWFKGSDGEPFLNSDANTHIPNQGEPSSCFVAKMSSWDPFIIYLVDPHMDAPSTGANSGKPAPLPGYPPPPSNVLPRAAGSQGKPICYNQPVVLQCLNTAVVSPVMIIRKVERGTMVVGGGQSSATNILASGGRVDPTVETMGDPVSQLHKIAFETLEDPKAPVPILESRDFTSPGASGPFLGCLNEEVGLRRPLGPRQWAVAGMSGPTTPTTPSTPMMMPMTSSNPVLARSSSVGQDLYDSTARMMLGGEQAAGTEMLPPVSPMQPQVGAMPAQHYSSGDFDESYGPSSPGDSPDEGDLPGQKRARRVSSLLMMQQRDRTSSTSSSSSSTSSKNRKRGQSLSMLSMQKAMPLQTSLMQQAWPSQQQQQMQMLPPNMQTPFPSMATASSDPRLQLRRTSSFANSASNSETSSSFGIPAGAMWTVEVHDSDVWTIVGTDIARHSFYIPTKLIGGVRSRIDAADQNIAHLINVPAPATPITPLPVVHTVHTPGSTPSTGKASAKGKTKTPSSKDAFVTLIGENFTSDLFIYFGDWRSTRVILEGDSTLYCDPPPAFDEFGLPRGTVSLLLVRRDGVVFPSQQTYEC